MEEMDDELSTEYRIYLESLYTESCLRASLF